MATTAATIGLTFLITHGSDRTDCWVALAVCGCGAAGWAVARAQQSGGLGARYLRFGRGGGGGEKVVPKGVGLGAAELCSCPL